MRRKKTDRAIRSRQPASASSEPPKLTVEPDPGVPGGGKGRTDVVGKVPPDIQVDPEITEGHPGYDESGPSEIIPLDRLAGGKADETSASNKTGGSE